MKKIQNFRDNDKLIPLLSTYLNDGATEVRLWGKKAILALVQGHTSTGEEQEIDPVQKQEAEKLFRKYIKKEFEVHKMMKVVD
mmetsp:Transcript_40038/g.38570  ORF Transcript_40038/g.38570 Transcript_40038/m.38570 type:complete len:83 (-) Transcript_40038:204-452(-)|eukprot:CAMPEP_0170551188 /NCGR_PEP_ID=MMETSP0211-20121228/9212_1 /TAXON_ID=311385 /ORGANISM="Pseudokeronopsis sp., Strain OXSARD2" /LENGTH=82 /DNA_ID=CAMNT_0010858205 /DNA_START=1501 /DNA_END=1749 /DNA_ORIENTATION=+